MKITDILEPEGVIPDLKGPNKAAVLRELAAHLAASHPRVKVEDLIAVLAERERLGSTAIGGIFQRESISWQQNYPRTSGHPSLNWCNILSMLRRP